MYIFIYIYFIVYFCFHILNMQRFPCLLILSLKFRILDWVEYIRTLSLYEMQIISASFFFSPQEKDGECTGSLPNEVI